MFPISLPAFGETKYFDNQENRESRVVLISDVTPAAFGDYCDLLAREGFTQKELFTADHRSFAAFGKDSWGVFLNYFAGTGELQLVLEENSAYDRYCATSGAACTTPRLTQIKLGDYALSDVIRLSDGRLLIIDGGNTYEQVKMYRDGAPIDTRDGEFVRVYDLFVFDETLYAAFTFGNTDKTYDLYRYENGVFSLEETRKSTDK